MLKSVLYYLLLLTTSVRFIDMIYLLAKDNTNLPLPVILVTTGMILYGIVLVVKRFASNVTLKQLTNFYFIQTVMIFFNIAYVALRCPLGLNAAETLIVGTFLDLIVNAGILYFGTKRMRRGVMSISNL